MALEQYFVRDASSEKRSCERRMASIFVMEPNTVGHSQYPLPCHTRWNQGGSNLGRDGGVCGGDGVLRLRRMEARPRHIQSSLRAGRPYHAIEQSHVFVHALAVLD